MNKNTKCCCKTIRSVAHLDIQYAHRFYGFKGGELLDEYYQMAKEDLYGKEGR